MDYILPALTLIGGLLVLVGELLSREDSAGSRLCWPRRMALGGGLLAIVTAFISAIVEGNQQGRIETLAGETRDLLTGGDSFAWLRMIEAIPGSNTFRAYLVHEGEIPTHDINIEFIGTDKCDEFESWTIGKAVGRGVRGPRNHFVPVLTEHSLRGLNVSIEPSCDDAYYAAYLEFRNRALLQQFTLKKDVDSWHVSTRVLDVFTAEEVLISVDSDDPSAHDWPDVSSFLTAVSKVQTALERQRSLTPVSSRANP